MINEIPGKSPVIAEIASGIREHGIYQGILTRQDTTDILKQGLSSDLQNLDKGQEANLTGLSLQITRNWDSEQNVPLGQIDAIVSITEPVGASVLINGSLINNEEKPGTLRWKNLDIKAEVTRGNRAQKLRGPAKIKSQFEEKIGDPNELLQRSLAHQLDPDRVKITTINTELQNEGLSIYLTGEGPISPAAEVQPEPEPTTALEGTFSRSTSSPMWEEYTPTVKPEPDPEPELPEENQPFIGLQARLMMGSFYINPDFRVIGRMIEQDIEDFTSRSYEPYCTASNKEREEYWQKKPDAPISFDEQIREWRQGLTNLIRDARHKDKIAVLKLLGSDLGIDFANFTQHDAAKIYDRYFEHGEKNNSEVKLYVWDIMTAYRADNHQIDYELLKQDLPTFEWLAKIFGGKSAEIIGQLIDTEVKVELNPYRFIAQANTQIMSDSTTFVPRVNHLEEKEKELLYFLWQYQTVSEEEEESAGADEPEPAPVASDATPVASDATPISL